MEKQQFIDIHSHYLFGLDDGSRSLEETLGMLEQAASLNIIHLLATPHATELTDDAFSEQVLQRFKEVQNEVKKAGIPVQGHIGLTPQTVSALGGYKVQGKSAQAAQVIIDDAKALEDAGCFSLVLEAITAPVARIITETVSIPTIGIGSGIHCDGQVLVTHDMLGLFDRFTPKFVKQYTKISEIAATAITEFKTDVEKKKFPEEQHSFNLKPDEFKKIERNLK